MQQKIAHREYGSGETIILLHGYAGSVLHWDSVVHTLSKTRRVVVPNLTHLYMSKTEIPFTHQLDHLARFILLKYPNQKVSLAGLSYGGAIAWAMAIKYPHLIKDIVLMNPMPPNPAGKFEIPILRQFFRLPMTMNSVLITLRTPLGRYFLRKASEVFRIERAELWDRIDDLHGRKLLFVGHVIQRFHWLLRNENWLQWKKSLPKLTHRILFLHSEDDSLFSKATYLKFSKMIPYESLIEIQNAGHIMSLRHGSELAHQIEAFLVRDQKKVG